MITETTITCKETVDLCPAHDPIHMNPKQKYGVENIRYRDFRATDSMWIKRPSPIHVLVNEILTQEAEVDWRMSHYRGSLERFVQEEGKEWELKREPGQQHTLDTIYGHTERNRRTNCVPRILLIASAQNA
jgi:hypothetical protein